MADRLDREQIQSRITTGIIGRQVEHYAEIDSTNTRAVAWAREGAADGSLVLADLQTAGRGRLGRRWHAPAGSSLLMSLILRPNLQPAQAQRTTMLCSLALVEAIAEITHLSASVKWPNDILLRGKKLGGVLTELGAQGSQLAYAVVGMGLNVNLDVSSLPELMAPSTSLQTELGRPVSRLDLVVAFLTRADALYRTMQSGWSPHARWRDYLDTLGKTVQVGTPDDVIEGVAEDVDADGALLLRTVSGDLRRVLVGDVTLRGHRTA